jgi:hypothetical protein
MQRSSGYRTLLLAASALAITACGGGGTETPTPQTSVVTPVVEDATITISSTSELSVAESDSLGVTLDIDYTGDKSLSVSIANNVDGLSLEHEIDASTLHITLEGENTSGLLSNSGNIVLTVTDGTATEESSIPVTLVNTSFQLALNEIERVRDVLSSADLSKELTNINLYLADKAYLYGLLDFNEKNAWLEDMDTLLASIESTSVSLITDAYDNILTQKSTITETDALNMLGDISTLNSEVSDSFSPILEEYASLSVPNFTIPSELQLTFFYDKYSLFYGNTKVGSTIDGEWVFNDDLKLLEKLLPFNSTLCTVTNKA